LLLAAVLATPILEGCQQPNEYVEPPPPAVTVSQPVKRPVTDYLEFTGTAAAVETVDIRARVVGFLESVNFNEGEFIENGQLLFTIDPKPYQAALDQARGELGRHKARLERAEIEFQRTSKLLKQNAASQAQVVKWKEEIGMAKADIVAAQAAVDKAKLDLGYTKVHTPISGRISRKLVDVGNLVGAGEYTLLTTVRKWEPIYAYFSINERDLLRAMKMAREENITADKPDKIPLELGLANETGYPHKGHLDFVDSTVDPNTGTVQMRGAFPNPGPPHVIVPGLFVRVRMPIAERENALLVTDRALGLDQGGRFVLVVKDDNVVEQRYVKRGALVEGMRVIEEGLKGDESVVVNGLQRAIPGAKVTPEQAEATKSATETESTSEQGSSNAKTATS
jgi:RND family efflux transporter MFP subunit